MQEHLTHRRKLIPFIAQKKKTKTYLEIGVRGGKTFYPVKVRKKIAVDPDFRIKQQYKKEQNRRYWPNYFAKYFECTSDYFFEHHAAKILKPGKLDLAFIDGLHTAEQTYIDVVNAFKYIADDGIIVVHDVSPQSAAAAYPASSIDEVKKIQPEGFNGMWSGDVWKIMPLLRKNFPDYFMFVIDHDSGIGLISKSPLLLDPDSAEGEKLGFTEQDLDDWTYETLDQRREELLNLKDDAYILEKCVLFN